MHFVKLAMVGGFALNQTAFKDSWQHYLGSFLLGHLGQQQLRIVDVASVIEISMHLSTLQMLSTALDGILDNAA